MRLKSSELSFNVLNNRMVGKCIDRIIREITLLQPRVDHLRVVPPCIKKNESVQLSSSQQLPAVTCRCTVSGAIERGVAPVDGVMEVV